MIETNLEGYQDIILKTNKENQIHGEPEYTLLRGGEVKGTAP